MCRLFGLHAAETSEVFQALVAADNALVVQSREHRDGWGIAYYDQGVPHVIRSMSDAQTDEAFRRVSESVRACTVIAHVRRATEGGISLVNCHPFQHGRWVMAHNGNLPQFQDLRAELVAGLSPHLLTHVFGTTDSEVYFARILHELDGAGLVGQAVPPLAKCASAFRRCVEKIEGIYQRAGIYGDLSLNVVLSNGSSMLGFRYHRDLHVNCGAADPQDGQKINRFLLSSEALSGENTWQSLTHGQLVGIDHEFLFHKDL